MKRATAIFEIPDYLVDDSRFIQLTKNYTGDDSALVKLMAEEIAESLYADNVEDFTFICLIVAPDDATEVLFEEDI